MLWRHESSVCHKRFVSKFSIRVYLEDYEKFICIYRISSKCTCVARPAANRILSTESTQSLWLIKFVTCYVFCIYVNICTVYIFAPGSNIIVRLPIKLISYYIILHYVILYLFMSYLSYYIISCLITSPVNSPHKGQWRRALMLSLLCAWINGWVNNGEAGDLRRHCVHHDVTVMPWCDDRWWHHNRHQNGTVVDILVHIT